MKRVSKDLFQDYLYTKVNSPKTVESYLRYADYYMDEFNVLNQKNLNKFLSIRRFNHQNSRCALRYLKDYIETYYDELEMSEEEFREVKEVDFKKISSKKRTEKLVNPLTERELKLVREKLTNDKYRLMFDLSFYGGLRISEMVLLRLDSFDIKKWKEEKEEWKIRSKKGETLPEPMGEVKVIGKGNRESIVLYPSRIIELRNVYARKIYDNPNISLVNGKSSFLFFPEKKSIPILKNVERDWQRKLRQAGIDAGITQFDQNGEVIRSTVVHPHRLRHSFAVHLLLNKHKDIRIIQEALRHKSITSTQIYTKLDKTSLRRELKDL